MKTNKGICNDWYFEELRLEMFSHQCTDVTQPSWSNFIWSERSSMISIYNRKVLSRKMITFLKGLPVNHESDVTWFHGFSWFLVGFHVFSRWFHGFPWFLVGFHGFSRWFHGFWLVSMVFKVVSLFFMDFGWFPWFFKVVPWCFVG